VAAALSRLDEDERSSIRITDGTSPRGGNPTCAIVSEAGLYSLILTSRSHKARPSKRWITHEVIPSIRKHGGYIAGQEKLATGEVSDAEFLVQALLVSQRVLKAAQDERDRLAAEQHAQRPP
jgi:anti-repressor protein